MIRFKKVKLLLEEIDELSTEIDNISEYQKRMRLIIINIRVKKALEGLEEVRNE